MARRLTRERDGPLGLAELIAIALGGMVGGGIFAVLGLAVQMAEGGVPLAFFISGLIAMLTAYAYVRLSVTYPSPVGTVEFLNQVLGAGLITGCIGAGGGFIIAPALMSAGIKGILAVGTDLFHIFAKAIMGTVMHRKLGNVSVPLACRRILISVH